MRGPASRTASLIPAQSPFDILAQKAFLQFDLVGFEVAAERFDDKRVEVRHPAGLDIGFCFLR
jgi:hypothetical protein